MTIDVDIALHPDGTRELVLVRNGAAPVRDYDTTASDVINNLFLFINAKDWTVVQTFYARNAVLKDEHSKVISSTPTQYFQELFEAEDINYIYISEQKTSADEVFAKAMTRKGARSAEYPYCFSFRIENSRIAAQTAVLCNR